MYNVHLPITLESERQAVYRERKRKKEHTHEFRNLTHLSILFHFFSKKTILVLASSVDPDEMTHHAAFLLCLHCLSKYEFGLSCLTNLGRVVLGQVLCGPSWYGASWFWVELSVIRCVCGISLSYLITFLEL